MDFLALQDGWIKIPAADFPLGKTVDEDQRLMIGVNQLLVKISGKTILIDAGLGDKFSDDELGLLGSERPRELLAQLSKHGVKAEDVNYVILTHLHYDHVGGCTRRQVDGSVTPVFPNAVHVVQSNELECALNPAPEAVDDYKHDDIQPLIDNGLIKTIDGPKKLIEGVLLIPTPGHCSGHQIVLIQEQSTDILFAGDLFSTKEHAMFIDLVTKYDLNPDQLIDQRRIWLQRIEKGGWTCFFCHNIRNPLGKMFQGNFIPLTRNGF